MNNPSSLPTALILCGGGGKGAFQIGVWKALIDYEIWKNIQVVSGASVGALNAVLYALDDFELAKFCWFQIRPDMLLKPVLPTEGALFSREGLIALMKKLPLQDVRKSRRGVFVSVYNVDRAETEFIRLNGLSKTDIMDCLLASSAIPGAFASVKMRGARYIDGGIPLLCEIPVQPLADAGFRGVLVVSLDSRFSLYGSSLPKEFPKVQFQSITPLDSLGGLADGTLDFSKTGVRDRMICGYQDAKKQLSGERVYMPAGHVNYNRVNAQIRMQMERLLPTGSAMERFAETMQGQMPNVPMPTLGGAVFYRTIYETGGWRVQQHTVPGMENHYRILDAQDVRRAWFVDLNDLLNLLDDYEAICAFGE